MAVAQQITSKFLAPPVTAHVQDVKVLVRDPKRSFAKNWKMSSESCKSNGKMKTLPKPCPSCPWRVDQHAADIPNFDMKMAKSLSKTCPDKRNTGPDFGAALFACHQSHDGEEFPCAGWLATVGHCHPGVRLSVSMGRLDSKTLKPGTDWPELHSTYPEVLEKLRADKGG